MTFKTSVFIDKGSTNELFRETGSQIVHVFRSLNTFQMTLPPCSVRAETWKIIILMKKKIGIAVWNVEERKIRLSAQHSLTFKVFFFFPSAAREQFSLCHAKAAKADKYNKFLPFYWAFNWDLLMWARALEAAQSCRSPMQTATCIKIRVRKNGMSPI